jgi:exosortase A
VIVRRPHSVWRNAIVTIGVLLALISVCYQQTVLYLLGLWNQLAIGEYGHGYLVLAISAYLIFHNRQRLSALSPRPTFHAIPAVLFSSVFWMLAALVDIELLQAVALLLLMLSVIWAVTGGRVTRILLFPILFIGFAIPFWSPLSPLLQQLTADTVFWIIRVIDVPAYRLDNTIVLPAGRLSIAEACSGLRYLLAALTLGTLYAYLNYSRLQSRLLVVLVFAIAAVLSNIIRVFIVVYLGYTSDMQHPLVSDHLNLGWYLFAGLIIVLFFVEALLHKRLVSHASVAHDDVDQGVLTQDTMLQQDTATVSFIPVALVLLLFIAAPPLTLSQLHTFAQAEPAVIAFPQGPAGWSLAEVQDDGWAPAFHGAHDFRANFTNPDGRTVYLYLGLYTQQAQGKELINDLNRISDNKGWRLNYREATRYNAGQQQLFEQLLENGDGGQRLVWYWYRVAGHNTSNKYQAKALQLMGLLQRKNRAAVVAIATDLEADSETTRNMLKQFLHDMGGYVERVIDNQ